MSDKKYELTNLKKEKYKSKGLYQVRALKDFVVGTFPGFRVKKGQLGGWVESEKNLSQSGKAWVSENARVDGDAKVYGDAIVSGKAIVSDNAEVFGNAKVSNNASVTGNAKVYENAKVYGRAQLFMGKPEVFGNASVFDNASVTGNAKVHGNAKVYENTQVFGKAQVYGEAQVFGSASVGGNAIVFDNTLVFGKTEVDGDAEVGGNMLIQYGELKQKVNNPSPDLIACSLNVYPVNGKYHLYKRAYKDTDGRLVSDLDEGKIYEFKIGEYLSVDDSKKLYVYTPFVSEVNSYHEDVLIAVEVKEEDVISCEYDKLLCKGLIPIAMIEK